jgi:methionine biosynthesis protein MetW
MDYRVKQIIGIGKRVVDLGCGSGEILADLADQFKERIGLDISRKRLKNSVQGDWIYYEADLNSRFPLEDGVADVVIANQVIEHIVDPVKFASEIHRVLLPGGRCVITTPNIRYLKNLASLLFSGYGPRTAGSNTMDGTWDDGHVHYFTHRDLRELFAELGFQRVDSCALIDLQDGAQLRRWIDRYAAVWPIREFLSGNILLWAEK